MDHKEVIAAAVREISQCDDAIKSLRAQKSHRSRWIKEAKTAIANAAAFSFNPAFVAEQIADYTETISRNEKAIVTLNADIARMVEYRNEALTVIASAKADEVAK